MDKAHELLSLLVSPQENDKKLIEKACVFAEKAHEGQTRFSGEPYFNHVFETAKTLAHLHMDAPTIAAGLLHDTLEDRDVEEAVIEKEFGKEVAFLVSGVTKISKYEYQGRERHAESLRKLLLAISRDIRVLIIKLADRLHNLGTLEYVRPDKQKRIALETLEIYAPIANRLGMGRIKGVLEDLAFPYAYPKEFKETQTLLKQKSRENQKYLQKVFRSLSKELAKENVTVISADYRIKHLYSLYKKLERYDMDIDKVYDIAALRVIVPTVSDCYRVLGVIHGMWRPLPGRIKDYIASPKLNGYQSLHTTIFTGDGGIAEIQIRTPEMHQEAEYGISSHLLYKATDTKMGKRALGKKTQWLKELALWQKQVRESGVFLEHLRTELFKDRVFVFTPDGDVVDLPQGATPIDFAYAIHSDIGDHTSGVRINKKFCALGTELKNGDIVEIVTKKGSAPSSKWLSYIKTTLARKHIKAALSKNT